MRPSAQGTLATRPLMHLLVYVRVKRLTGRLALQAPDSRGGAIDFWRGQIAAVSTSLPPPSSGGGAADLAEQACRKIDLLFTFPPPSLFAFYDGTPSAAEPPLMLDPIAPVWRGIRDAPVIDGLAEVLAPFAKTSQSALRVVNEGPIARAGFTPDERALCEALATRPMTLAHMRVTFSAISLARLERLVYLLLITKCAEPATQPALPAPTARTGSMTEEAIAAALKGNMRSAAPREAASAAPPPRNMSTPPSQPTNVVGPVQLGAPAIVLRAKAVQNEDYFQALGLTADASIEAASAAYFRLVKLWHPDRLPAELASVKAEVAKIFAHMTQAHQTLTQPEARRTYLAAWTEKATSVKRPREETIRLVDAALVKRNWAFAADESRRLVEANPDDAEALALVVWCSTLGGEAPDHVLQAALPILERALTRDPNCARAHFYRGMLHKRFGNAAAAHRDFARAIQLDPKHVDAARELRIIDTRARDAKK